MPKATKSTTGAKPAGAAKSAAAKAKTAAAPTSGGPAAGAATGSAKATVKAPAAAARKAAPRASTGSPAASKAAAAKGSAPRKAAARAADKAAVAGAPAARKAAAPAKVDVKFLAEQRALLLEERLDYDQQAVSLKAEADQLAAEMEPGDVQFDEESGEGDSINVERERDLALSAQARAAVDEIDRALAKIDAGTYGNCEHCGQPIPRARLRALPYAALCVACKSGGLSRR